MPYNSPTEVSKRVRTCPPLADHLVAVPTQVQKRQSVCKRESVWGFVPGTHLIFHIGDGAGSSTTPTPPLRCKNGTTPNHTVLGPDASTVTRRARRGGHGVHSLPLAAVGPVVHTVVARGFRCGSDVVVRWCDPSSTPSVPSLHTA